MKQLRKSRATAHGVHEYDGNVRALDELLETLHSDVTLAEEKLAKFKHDTQLTPESRAACQRLADAHARLMHASRMRKAAEAQMWAKFAAHTSRQKSIVLAPGMRFGQLLGLFMTRKAYRMYVYPAIAEMQAEYFEELTAGHIWRARWVSLRGQLYLIPGWLYGLAAKAIVEMFSA